MKCRHCKNRILQKSGNRVRLRTKGQIVFEGNVCTAQCYWCGEYVEIPVSMNPSTNVTGERFMLTEILPS